MIVNHALDYLKGIDAGHRFSYTQEFFTDLGDWAKAIEMLSIAEIAEDYPEWNPNHEPKTPTT